MSIPYNKNTGGYYVNDPYYQNRSVSYPAQGAVSLGGVGAVIGAVGAAAAVIPQVNNSEITKSQAAVHVAKEAAGTGLATAAAGVVMRTVGLGGFTGLVGMFAVATGVKYLWNRTVDGQVKAQPEKAESKTTKKTAKK
ncbi:magnetosome protein MamC [Dethiosulfatarculus sandiegensis]|uniref:Uncharacterized protein n=1 Tax=Dethiosulfatarculus sandiegensis TaxID=1429043 RepID=A0A0D2K1A5_9BACT|nr:magnetosome protein MamC [Dethiosulfatarculus sandiegensis]KIX15460.1 hypothetical protein X474_04135 [Dethiosulfatarculus sandiegensis]